MDAARRNKLKYRAWHRGFKEADLILGPFADSHVASMDAAELDQFETLLDVPDQDLFGWIIGREPTPEPFRSPLMDRIRASRFGAHQQFDLVRHELDPDPTEAG